MSSGQLVDRVRAYIRVLRSASDPSEKAIVLELCSEGVREALDALVSVSPELARKLEEELGWREKK